MLAKLCRHLVHERVFAGVELRPLRGNAGQEDRSVRLTVGEARAFADRAQARSKYWQAVVLDALGDSFAALHRRASAKTAWQEALNILDSGAR